MKTIKLPKVDVVTVAKWTGIGLTAIGGSLVTWAGSEESKKAIMDSMAKMGESIIKKN